MIRVRLSLQYPALEAGVRALLNGDPDITLLDDEPATPTAATADVHVMTSAVFAHSNDTERAGETDSGALLVLDNGGIDQETLWALSAPWGLLPLDASSEELTAAIRAVAAGLIVGTSALLSREEAVPGRRGPLTEREVEVLGLLYRGLANKQVAAELGISEHTVKFHVSSIYTKLNVSSRTEAVREGLRNGWIAL